MYNPTFIGDIDLNEDTLQHYGVKGMKWRRRKNKTTSRSRMKRKKFLDKINSWLDEHTDTTTTTTTKSYSGDGDYYTPHTTERDEGNHHITTTTTSYPSSHRSTTTERDEGNHHIKTTTTTYAPGYSETTETKTTKRKKKK